MQVVQVDVRKLGRDATQRIDRVALHEQLVRIDQQAVGVQREIARPRVGQSAEIGILNDEKTIAVNRQVGHVRRILKRPLVEGGAGAVETHAAADLPFEAGAIAGGQEKGAGMLRRGRSGANPGMYGAEEIRSAGLTGQSAARSPTSDL